MEVQARVLPNPRLTYGSPANYDPKGSASNQAGSCTAAQPKPAWSPLPCPAWHAPLSPGCMTACLLLLCPSHSHPQPPRLLCLPPLLPANPLITSCRSFGAWNLRDVRFLAGSQLASWGIACFANPRFAEADLCRPQAQSGPSFIKARPPACLPACLPASAPACSLPQSTPSATCPFPPAPPPPLQEFIDMLNSCGVVTPTSPLPPCIMAPRDASAAEVMRRAADAARQTFKKPVQLILVVLPDTGGWAWVGLGGWVGGCRWGGGVVRAGCGMGQGGPADTKPCFSAQPVRPSPPTLYCRPNNRQLGPIAPAPLAPACPPARPPPPLYCLQVSSCTAR